MINKRLFKIALLLLGLTHWQGFADTKQSLHPDFDLANYQGKVVYLDFWASWCIPCRKSFPWMNEIRKKYSEDELVIIAVNLDKKKELAEAFLQTYSADFKIIYDPKGKLAKHYQIQGMPSSILFDQKGQPQFAHTGFFTEKISDYRSEIEQLLKQRN